MSTDRPLFGGLAANGLPMTLITQEMILEFRNIFDLYDKKKKGYLNRDEFITSLSGLYDLDRIIAIMKTNVMRMREQSISTSLS